MGLLSFLERFQKREREDFRIEFPGVEVAVNHSLKVVFLYDLDSDMPQDRYTELETHLNRRGYLLQVCVAPVGLSVNPSKEGHLTPTA